MSDLSDLRGSMRSSKPQGARRGDIPGLLDRLLMFMGSRIKQASPITLFLGYLCIVVLRVVAVFICCFPLTLWWVTSIWAICNPTKLNFIGLGIIASGYAIGQFGRQVLDNSQVVRLALLKERGRKALSEPKPFKRFLAFASYLGAMWLIASRALFTSPAHFLMFAGSLVIIWQFIAR